MKLISLSIAVGFWMLCWPVQGSWAQEVAKDAPTSMSTVVLSLAQKTLGAIRGKDAALLSELADRRGVYIGTDVEKMSAARFGKELSEHRGVYCVIFENSCRKDKSENLQLRPSLRDALMHQEVTMNISSVEGAPGVKAVAVETAKNPDEIVFTLMFRHVRGDEWVLQQIEY